jgi:protocatechuate 3,4-dioxygenase beta subunit
MHDDAPRDPFRNRDLTPDRPASSPREDDAIHGRVLTRRALLGLLGAGGVVLGSRPARAFEALVSRAVLASAQPGRSAGACVVRPAQTQGPYFVDEGLLRSDIRSDPTDASVRPGTPLHLQFAIRGLLAPSGCIPLAGVHVDLWHCDALGVYSDAQDPSFDTRGKKFLRGYQVTDADGLANFVTIYPGWYSGRTVHIHFKLRSAPEAVPGFEFTSQLYFDDALTDIVHAQPPYSTKGQRTLRNSGDGIYNQGGSQLVLAAAAGDDGYAATFDVALANVVGVRPGVWSDVKKKFS